MGRLAARAAAARPSPPSKARSTSTPPSPPCPCRRSGACARRRVPTAIVCVPPRPLGRVARPQAIAPSAVARGTCGETAATRRLERRRRAAPTRRQRRGALAVIAVAGVEPAEAAYERDTQRSAS